MKKRLLFTAVLLWQTAVFAQQAVVKKPAQQIFEEAFRYLNGLGTTYDPPKAVQLFKQAAASGNGASMNALGNLHAKGEAGLVRDMDAAIDYYTRAGQAG